MKHIILPTLVKIISLGIVVGSAVFLGNQFLAQRALTTRYQAIDSCGQIATVTYKTPDGAEVTQPDEKWYTKCLTEKKLQ